MKKLEADMTELCESTKNSFKEFEESKYMALEACQEIKRELDRKGRRDEQKDELRKQLNAVSFWDFSEERKAKKAKPLLEKMKDQKGGIYRYGEDVDTKFNKAYEKLSALRFSYKEDMQCIINFYKNSYDSVYEKYIFEQKQLFVKFIERYTKRDLLRDLKDKRLKELFKSMEKLKSSTNFEVSKVGIMWENQNFLRKYVSAKWWGKISERTVYNWLTDSNIIKRENLLQLAFILKMTKEELNDTLKKLGHRELYYLDARLQDFLVYRAIEYNQKHDENPLSYSDVQELAEYGTLLLENHECEDEFVRELTDNNHFNRKFMIQLNNKIIELEEKIKEIKKKLDIETEEIYRVQAVLTNMLITESVQMKENSSLKKMGEFDGSKQWIKVFVETFSALYQYQYISKKITLYELFRERFQKDDDIKSTNVFELYSENWSIDRERGYEKVLNAAFFNFMKNAGLNRRAAIKLILLTYLSEINASIMNETLEKLHFGSLNPRIKGDAILLSFIDYIGIARITDNSVIKFLKIFNELLESEESKEMRNLNFMIT